MNTKFIVNKENKFTKAISTDFIDVADEIANDPALAELAFLIMTISKITNNSRNMKTVNRRDFSAICKCAEDDVYDETVGKDVAEEKACLKYHKAMISDYKFIIKKLNSFIDIINKKIDKHEKKINNITNHISKY